MVALWIPLFTDFFLDIIQRYKRKSDNKSDNTNDYERGILLIGLISSPIMGYVNLNYNHLSLLWFCMTRFQIITVMCTLRVSFTRFDRDYWPPWLTWLGTLTLTVAVNLTTYTSCRGDEGGPLTVLSTVLKALSMVGLAVPSCRWLLRAMMTISRSHTEQNDKKESFNPRISTRKRSISSRLQVPTTTTTTPSLVNKGKRRKSHLIDLIFRNVRKGADRPSNVSYVQDNTQPHSQDQHYHTDHLIFPALYVSVGTISFVIITLMLMILASADKFTPILLVLYNASFIILELMLLVYYLRKIKFESVYNLMALMDQKKSYLRYVSHEIRTPLHSATLGAKLLLQSLEDLVAPDPFEQVRGWWVVGCG
jgi:hypothetical protein